MNNKNRTVNTLNKKMKIKRTKKMGCLINQTTHIKCFYKIFSIKKEKLYYYLEINFSTDLQ